MTRRPSSSLSFRPVLVAQAVLVLTLCIASALWGFLRARSEDGATTKIRKEVRLIDAHLRDTVMGANDFVSSTDETDRLFSMRSLTAARLTLAGLAEDTVELAMPIADVLTELDVAEDLAKPIWTGTTSEERVRAMRRFDVVTAEIFGRMDQLDGMARVAARGRQQNSLFGMLGGILAVGLVYLVAGLIARKRYQQVVESESAGLDDALRSIESHVREARPGAASTTLPGWATLHDLTAATDQNARAVAELRRTLERERLRSAFSYHLAEALDLADTEKQLCASVLRAAFVAFPGNTAQVLLSDNSQSELVPFSLTVPRVCAPSAPHTCPTIRKGRLLSHEANGGLARCPHLLDEQSAVMCAPLSARGVSIGVLQVVGPKADREEEVLAVISATMGTRLSVIRMISDSELQASTDVLTGLANRRAMNERLARLDRSSGPYTLISADLDHFKKINDTYGHEAGDRCLKIFAQVLRDACRGNDLPCRPGGEEFTVVLHATEHEGGRIVAERIRSLLADASRRAGVAFTVSLGVASRPDDGETAEDVQRVADTALYAAKEGGRDRVVIASSPLVSVSVAVDGRA